MNDGDAGACPCTVCKGVGSQSLPMRGPAKPGRKPGSQPGHKAAAASAIPAYQDEEHVPDMLRVLIDRLKREGQLETDFREELSMDWRSERNSLPRQLDALPKYGSFVPRVGELVLFVRFLDNETEICREDETGRHKLFDTHEQVFRGLPTWEAGVVAQNAPVQLEDILQQSQKENFTLAGFRIEPLPKPGSSDKGASKKFKYVPFHWMRPFVLWKEFLSGVAEQNWHSTVHHAMTAMATFSLVEKYSFSGTWPTANLHCKGVYVGSELWVAGDALRIRPDAAQDNVVTDVLHVTSVVLRLSNLDKTTGDDHDDRHPYNSAVWLYGKMYTTKKTRAWNGVAEGLTKQEEHTLPQGLKGYKLHHRHDPRKSVRAPIRKILGRCFEAESLQLWVPATAEVSKASLSLGLSGVDYARDYAKKHDERILPEKYLFWADSRGQALDIAELNGVLLSGHDPDRDEEQLDDWASSTRVLANAAGKFDKFRLQAQARETSKDRVLPTTESRQENSEDISPEPMMSGAISNDNKGVTDELPRLRLPSATPSDELDDQDDEATVKQQWGLGKSTLTTQSTSAKSGDDKDAEESEEDENEDGGEDQDEDEEEDEEISARFGLGRDNRKRSRSVAEMNDKGASGDSGDEQKEKNGSGAGVKGVARSLAQPISKVANALGLGRSPDMKRARTSPGKS